MKEKEPNLQERERQSERRRKKNSVCSFIEGTKNTDKDGDANDKEETKDLM